MELLRIMEEMNIWTLFKYVKLMGKMLIKDILELFLVTNGFAVIIRSQLAVKTSVKGASISNLFSITFALNKRLLLYAYVEFIMESDLEVNCGRLQNIPIATTRDKISFLLQLQQEMEPSNWISILENVKKNPSNWITTFQNTMLQVLFHSIYNFIK